MERPNPGVVSATTGAGKGISKFVVETSIAGPVSADFQGGKVAGGGATRKTKKRSSKFNTKYGTAEVKAFPIHENELYELGGTGVLASIAASAATYFVSLGIDFAQQIAFTPALSPETLEYLKLARNGSFGLGTVCAIVAVGLFAFGANKIRNIIKRTTFDEE